MRLSVGQTLDDAHPSEPASYASLTAMSVDSRPLDGLDGDIRSLVTVAANIHSTAQRHIKSRNLSHPDATCLKKIAGEILHLSGSLHSLHLLLSALASDDLDPATGTRYNLEHFRRGQRTVHRLDSDLCDALTTSESGASGEVIRAGDSGDDVSVLAGNSSHSEPPGPSFHQRFSHIPSQIQQYRILLGLALASESLASLLAALSQRSAALDRPVSTWRDRVPRVIEQRCPFEPADYLEKLLAQQFSGAEASSGNWVGTNETFLRWKNGSDAGNTADHLWLRGEAGVGKSVLTASIVRELLEQSDSASRSDAVCFHFVDWKDHETRQAKKVLTAFLCQLGCQSAGAFNKLRSSFWKELNSGPLPEESLKEGFAILRGHFESVYVIIDGVDDLKQPAEFLQTVVSTLSIVCDARILLSSREKAGVQVFCDSLSGLLVLEAVPPTCYIQAFVQSSIDARVKAGGVQICSDMEKAIVSVLSSRQK